MSNMLMKSALDGDADAVTQIIQEHYHLIYRYCYWKTGNCDTAQDITQETFLRFVSNLHTYSHRGKLPPAQQEVMILRYGQDLKLREIASITGTTIFAVQYRLKRALTTLKKQLGSEGSCLEERY